MLEDQLPGLLPELRPYQRRAAYWMVKREKGDFEHLGGRERSQIIAPLCMPLNLIETSRRIYYNPFRCVPQFLKEHLFFLFLMPIITKSLDFEF